MPYLHWEMDQKRAEMANLTKLLIFKHHLKQTRHHRRSNMKLAKLVKENMKEIQFGFLNQTKGNNGVKQGIVGDPNGLFSNNKACGPTGLFLMQAANLFEAMELEPDIKLLHSYLHHNPPFHPRRTLDQSYHSKLESTELRDRNQVVYRGTRGGRKIHGSSRVVIVDQLWMYILDESQLRFCLNKSSHFTRSS